MDRRIDETIANALPFAQPILREIRAALHAANPALEETIKWGMPFFLREGRPFAMMNAFKAHAAFGFWKGRATGKEEHAMGQFGRLTSLDDLPPRAELITLIRAAEDAADRLASAAPQPKTAKAPIAEPEDLTAALDQDAAAKSGWAVMPPGARREYLEWIVSAKRTETRAARIGKATAQLREGKKLNWKYENC